MFFFFALCRASDVIELGRYDYSDYIGKDTPAFVKFYNPTCPHCFAMNDEFWQASEMFEGKIAFCAIDCIAHRELCVKTFGIEKYPTVALFKANSEEAIIYNDSMVADDFGRFAENITNITAKKIPKLLFEITPTNFDYWKSSKKCAFAVFYSSFFPHHKRFLMEARMAAEIYEGDENVTLGIIRCDKYRSMCDPVSGDGYPVAMRYTNGIGTRFTDMALVNFVVNDINDNCDCYRKLDGTLMDHIGLIEEAGPIAKEFAEADEAKRSELIEKMKAIPGTSYYLKVMQRIKKEGIPKVKKTMEKMEITMMNKTVSRKNRDIIKTNYNVFRAFFPPPPTPTPTPAPPRTPIPDPFEDRIQPEEQGKPGQKSSAGQKPKEFDDL
jgi:thiol-disulfide isomerase/thioredoxin